MDDSKIKIRIDSSRFVLEKGELPAVIEEIGTEITAESFDAALQSVREE